MNRVAVIGVFLSFFTLVAVTPSFADEVLIPFGVYVNDFKIDAKEHGLDLNDVDGFVENKGMRIEIFTYKPIDIDQLNLIKNLALKHRRK